MNKLRMHSLNKVEDNIEKIGRLFPNCLTERKGKDGQIEYAIDFDVLRQELSDIVVEGAEERYQFTWPDKRKSMLLANTPIAKTLRPCREESVNFDNTQNLYIEGDNLDVLKLLQETYLGKVKMIYIDPPYNTGNDFVYEDDFAMAGSEFMDRSGMYDEEGNQLFDMKANNESNGRFHTDWLNMIYPRLKVAKDLLSDDGAIFISIGVEEISNLKSIMNEVFGESNFVEIFSWVKTSTPPALSIKSRKTNEYILCYEKKISSTQYKGELLGGGSQPLLNSGNSLRELLFPADVVKFNTKIFLDGKLERFIGDRVELLDDIIINNGYAKDNFRLKGEFKWTQDFLNEEIKKGTHFIVNTKGLGIRFFRVTEGYKRPTNFIKEIYTTPIINKNNNNVETNESASKETAELMGGYYFDHPKPVSLIKYLSNFICESNDIILDFFSGSATTAHAVMQLNADDGGTRKFICVQLPEATDEKSEANKAGYKNICEIGKERIRRAGAKIIGEQSSKEDRLFDNQEKRPLDIGFRVLKLDSTNMKDVYYHPEEYTPALFSSLTDNIKEDRTPEDLLFQVMLELGVLPSSKIEEQTIEGKRVFNVADNYLIACFDEQVTESTVMAIAQQKPYYFVMRDSSMASDSVATNFEQLFETYSKETIRRVL